MSKSPGNNSNRYFVSTGNDGTHVALWYQDDNSGRQQWILVPAGKSETNLYYIRVFSGINNARKYVSVESHSKLYLTDDIQANNKSLWRIEKMPLGDYFTIVTESDNGFLCADNDNLKIIGSNNSDNTKWMLVV